MRPQSSCIILAAGCSQRMGTPKTLLHFAGSTVIARVVDAFISAQVDHTIVVLRPGDEKIRRALAGRPVTFVENPDSQGDMLSSLRRGLCAKPAITTEVIVGPADQPGLSAGLVKAMLAAFRAGTKNILVPVYQGRRGHPLIFAASLSEEILSTFDGVGLRGLLQAHPTDVCEWSSPDPATTQDLDTPADYVAALRAQIVPLLGRGKSP